MVIMNDLVVLPQ